MKKSGLKTDLFKIESRLANVNIYTRKILDLGMNFGLQNSVIQPVFIC